MTRDSRDSTDLTQKQNEEKSYQIDLIKEVNSLNVERRSFLRGTLMSSFAAGGFSSFPQLTAAQEEKTITVEQGDSSVEVTPLSTGETIEEFYDYYNARSHTSTNIEQSDASLLFFWEGPNGLSLVVLHDKALDGSGAACTFEFDGLPTDQGRWILQDDSNDFDSDTDTSPDWTWADTKTDGGVFRGGLNEDVEITTNPRFNEDAVRSPLTPGKITEWQLLSGDADDPERIQLDMDTPVTIWLGDPEVDLELENVRLVQTVEDTWLEDAEDPAEIPQQIPLIENRATTTLFDLTGDIDQLSDPVTVQIKSNDNSIDEVFNVKKALVDKLVDDDNILDTLTSTNSYQAFDTNNDGNFDEDGIPVFDLSSGVSEITVEVLSDSEMVASREAQVDLPIITMPPLNIGIVGVEQASRYNEAIEDTSLTPEKDYYSSYESMVENLAEYLQQIFPTPQVNVYRHDADDMIDSLNNQDPSEDRHASRELLERQLPISGTSESTNTFSVKSATTDKESEFTVTEQEGFDVTFCITPVGYFVYYSDNGKEKWSTGTRGAHLGGWGPPFVDDPLRQPAASTLVRVDSPETGAHEAGHHFLGQPYDGDLAYIDDNGNNDDSHTSRDLKSTTFELEGHEYTANYRINQDENSFMTQGVRGWMDMLSHELLVDDEFTPTPPEGTKEEALGLVIIGEVVETGIKITSVTTSIGYVTDLEVGDLSAILSDANDNTIGTFTYPAGVIDVSQNGSLHLDEDLVYVELPFPEETYQVQFEVNDTVTVVNPIEHTLRDAIDRIPDTGFINRPEERRQALFNDLDAIDKQMEEKAFRSAEQKMQRDIHNKIEKWLENDYETAANQPTKQEILDLVDSMIDRLEMLAENNRGGGR